MLVVTYFMEFLSHITCCLKNTGLNNKENVLFHIIRSLEIERFQAWLSPWISHVIKDLGFLHPSNLSLSAALLMMMMMITSTYLVLAVG